MIKRLKDMFSLWNSISMLFAILGPYRKPSFICLHQLFLFLQWLMVYCQIKDKKGAKKIELCLKQL